MRKIYHLLLLVFSLALMNASVYAQEKTITGTIVSDDGNTPLSGVTVRVKGTTRLTQTNNTGQYSINASIGEVLQFSHVTHETAERIVRDATVISFVLKNSEKALGEVIVGAYGTKKSKRELGYSVQEVQGEDIAQTQRENWINALAGRVAGATITQTSGAPGASSSIVLRGAVSIGGNNQPLIIVDGVPYDNQTMNQESLASGNSLSFGNRNSDYGNRAMDINSEDIETVTVLKGPEATALYGSDGASGAIVITTRKGKIGKAIIRYDNSFRAEKVYRFPEIQQEYGRGLNGVSNINATVAHNTAGTLFAYFGPKYAPGTKLYDNINAFFKTGFTQKHNVSVDGGSEVSTYRLSANYTSQDGIVPNTAFERFSFKLGGSAKFSPKINLLSSITYNTSVTDKASKGSGGYLMNLLNFPSDIDVTDYKNIDGTRKLYRAGSGLTSEFDNPFWDVNKNKAQDKVDRATSNFTLNILPYKWLALSLTTGLDFYSQTGDFLMHPQSRFGFSTNGFYSLYEQTTKNWSNVAKATMKKNFNKFTNTLTVGFSNDDNKTNIEAQRGERFYEIDFKSINNTEPTSRDSKSTYTNVRKVRFFGNYVLGYDKILYASFAGNREGTSTFMSRAVDKDPFYNFGAASLSFVFGDLKIFNSIPWLSYGKSRLSYGTTGKGPWTPYIIDYTFQSQSTTGGGFSYGFTGNNFNLRPEITKNLEIGGELKFFKNRFGIDFTHYILKSKDQILAARASYGTGYVIKYFNGGLVENKGYEAVLTASLIKTKNTNWDLTINFDKNRGKIVKMPADLPTYYDSDTWVYGNMRSQAYAGSFTGNISSFNLARNTNNQVLISPTSGLPFSNGNFEIAGDRQPDFKFAVINSFNYKEFTFSFNLDFRKGGDVFNANEHYLYFTGLSKRTLDREQPVIINGILNDGFQNTTKPTTNTITVYPYYRSDYYGSGVVTEADFMESVNWIRLRDATFMYRLPQSIIKNQKAFKSLSVFLTGTDLFMITNYTGADPSVNANTAFARGFGGAGIDFGSIATPRGINAGLKVQF